MRKARSVLAVAGLALMALSACGSKGPDTHLMNLHSGSDGPDEFSILPPKALTMPKDLTVLPPPSPGGANLTDQNPMGDAIVALGGKVGGAGGIPAADAGLVNYADRNGVSPGIRATLAQEDLTFRKRHPGRLLERAVGQTTYFQTYAPLSLNAYQELYRWRAAGVQTPSAPPKDTFK